MKITISASYTMKEAAGLMTNPVINTRPKLFRFLRKHGILVNSLPAPEFVCAGYFTVRFHYISNGTFKKTVPIISVTKSGIKFLNKLISLIVYGKY